MNNLTKTFKIANKNISFIHQRINRWLRDNKESIQFITVIQKDSTYTTVAIILGDKPDRPKETLDDLIGTSQLNFMGRGVND